MNVTDKVLSDAIRAKAFKSHVQGAIVRSVGSLIMWLFALFAFLFDEIQVSHFTGLSCSVLFLVLIGPPTLFIIKRIALKKTYANFSLFINLVEVVGYTAAIYSLGGFEATYLTPVYAALITYLGVMAPRRVPFIVACFCAFAFGSVVALEAFGIIPSQNIDPHFNPSLAAQVIRVSVVIGLLFLVAYISSFTAGKLKQGRLRLRLQNKELEENAIQLENSRRELKAAHNGLETMVAKLQTEIAERKQAEKELEKLITELKNALKEIKTLRGILPICSFCKKIRDDKGYWEQVDVYISKYSPADISHSICPDCAKKHYPDIYKKLHPDQK